VADVQCRRLHPKAYCMTAVMLKDMIQWTPVFTTGLEISMKFYQGVCHKLQHNQLACVVMLLNSTRKLTTFTWNYFNKHTRHPFVEHHLSTTVLSTII
jgi:hypothetical protein